MNPANRCMMFIDELSMLVDSPDLLVERLSNIANELLNEGDDEICIRSITTILRVPSIRPILNYQTPEGISNFIKKYSINNGHALLAKYSTPYTKDEVDQ